MLKRVLAIDDEEHWRLAISRILGASYDLRLVTTVDEFNAMLNDQSWYPQVLIIDWLLDTGITGLTAPDLIDRLSLQDRLGDIIILTQMIARSNAVEWVRDRGCRLLDKDNIDGLPRVIADHPWSKTSSEDLMLRQWVIAKARQEALQAGLALAVEFAEIISIAVDESFDFDRFCQRLLGFLIKNSFSGAAVTLFSRGEAIVRWRSEPNITLPSQLEAKSDSRQMLNDKVLSRELGDPVWFKGLLAGTASQSPGTDAKVLFYSGAGKGCVAVNDFKSVSVGPRQLLVDCRSNDVRRFANILVIPVQRPRIIPQHPQENLLGYVLLFDKDDGTQFGQGEAETLVTSLPVGSIVISALEMPFRYEKRGLVGQLLDKLLARVNLRSWELEEYFLGSLITLLRFGLLTAAVLAIGLPLSDLAFGTKAQLMFNVVHHLDVVIITFSMIVVAIGILALYDPRFATKFGGNLPPWMARFGQIGALKRTILTLICIIVAISLLQRFLSSDHDEFNRDPTWFVVEILFGLAIIVVLGVFIHLNLREPEESPDTVETDPAKQ